MKRIFIILFCTQFFLFGKAQMVCDSVKADSVFYKHIINLPEKYQKPFLMAFSFYPELSNYKIIFKEKRINTTLNVRPALGSLFFRSKDNRKYIIRINNSKRDSMILLNKIPCPALIGLFGHELSHILDFKSRTNREMIRLACSYLNTSRREQYEKSIDSLTIKRGLGYYLLQWSLFVQYQSDASFKYKQLKRDFYMEPKEIEDCLNNK